ncbi:MAG: hypothetical protein QHJ73_11245, partial [Armatimonadota bacterium]|nr:hypothetical protein [Armatimonadota bacterium]
DLLAPELIHAAYGPDAEKPIFGRTLGAQAGAEGDHVPARQGDVFVAAAPYTKIPWIEAILGCPIRVSLRSHSFWAEAFVSAEQLSTFAVRPDERWTNKLMEFTRYLVANARGRYLVAHTLMRGVSDMLVAMLGDALFCQALYDTPDVVHRLADQCADLFIQVARAQLALIPPFHGGWCNLFGIWAPGRSVRSQDDATALLSPQLYERFILPYQRRIADAFDYSTIHLHSACLHVAPLVCDSNFSAVQVSVDPVPFGPPMADLIPVLARMAQQKPLLVEGPMTEAELDEALRVLPGSGLFVGASIEAAHERPV